MRSWTRSLPRRSSPRCTSGRPPVPSSAWSNRTVPSRWCTTVPTGTGTTSGTPLLKPAAVKKLREELLPLALLVTPNLSEAGILTGHTISSVEAMRRAARQIHSQSGCAVLVKGGHLRNSREALDIFFDGQTELLLSAPFVKSRRTHGTGCTYSAAICAALALGHDLPQAVQIAKNFITSSIANSYRAGNHFALNHFPPA